MKTTPSLWLFGLVSFAPLALLAFPASATAADSAGSTPSPTALPTWAIVAIPSLIAAIKAGLGRLPSRFIPLLAPVLGSLGDLMVAGGLGHGTLWGGILGLAGVGVREIWDQNKDLIRLKNTAPCLAALPLLWICSGCAHTSQKFSSPVLLTNGTVAQRTMENHVSTGFQSSTLLEKVRLSNGTWNGDRQSFGVDSIKQEADATKFADVMGAIVLKGLASYLSGGAAALVPTTSGSTGNTAAVQAASVVGTNTVTYESMQNVLGPGSGLPSTVKVDGSGNIWLCYPSGGCVIVSSNSILHTK